MSDNENKNAFLDGYLVMKKWIENRNAGKTFVDYFHECGYSRIAIYDATDIGKLLYDEIKGTFSCKNSIVAVCKDKLWNVIDSEGNELLSEWTKYSIIPSKDSRMITIDSKAIQNVDCPKSLQYINGGKVEETASNNNLIESFSQDNDIPFNIVD